MAIDLRPARLDVEAIAGNDVVLIVTATNGAGAAIDLTNYAVDAAVYRGGEVVVAFADSLGGAGNNVVTLALSEAQTLALADDDGLEWSLRVEDGGDTREWLAGRITLHHVGTGGTPTVGTVALTVGTVEIAVTAIGTGAGGLTVDSVNGMTGDVVLTAADFGAVETVNGQAGPDVVLTAADVGAATAAQGATADTAVQPDDLTPYALLNGPTFTGTPTAPTAAPGTNTTQLANTAFVVAAVAALIGSAPGALDTLAELADAINDDANFAAAMATALAGKQPIDGDLTTLAGAGNSAILAAVTAAFTEALATKLAGIATGATANATDAELRDRTTHTGAQAIATVTGLQAALDAKMNLAQTVNNQTGTTYTVAGADRDTLVTLTNAAAITVTLPTPTSLGLSPGDSVDFAVLGAGMATFVADTGATVNGTPSLITRAQYSAATAVALTTTAWLVVGDLA